MNKLIILLLPILFFGCSQQKMEPLPEHIQELENLTVYSAGAEPAVDISFQKDVTYGDSDEVLFRRMGEVAVDSLGRVFIADPRDAVIYSFDSDGRFITRLGGSGAGPGEFDWWVRNVQVLNHHVYALDANRNRVHKYSLETLEIEKTVSLAENRRNYRGLARAFPNIDNVFLRGDGTYVAEFIMNDSPQRIQPYGNRDMRVFYYLLDENGRITKKLLTFIREVRSSNGTDTQHRAPLFGRVMNGFSSDDRIYLAEPDDFLVRIYNRDGEYQSAFFYSINKIPLTTESANEARAYKRHRFQKYNIDNMELFDLPEFWPVLTDMKIDDQDRLWIATTVDDMSIYEWWVLEKNGELITTFEWPRSVPIEVVKNGYMYTSLIEEETGLQQVVRYRIKFEEV